jgi:hypothetical protein
MGIEDEEALIPSFHTRASIVALAKMKIGRVHYNRLFFTSEEVSLNNYFVCP